MPISRGPYARNIRAKSGNIFLLSNRDTAHLCREALQAAYDGDASMAKAAAADSGMSPKAAENWLAAENPMSLTAFLNAYRNNTAFRAWAKKIMFMEADRDPAFEAELARFIRAAQTVSAND